MADNSVRKQVRKSAISVDKIYKAEYQKAGTKTAQLRQVITTDSFYPSKQVSSDLGDNPFSLGEFGFEEQKFTQTENRVCWINIPAVIDNTDDVLAKLATEATLYKIMSNKPILSSNQAYSIEQGLKTMDDYANSQITRYGENHPNAGQLILDDNGKPQYRAVFYSQSAKDDVDLRTSEPTDYYASSAIKAEMTGSTTVVEGQSL